MYNQQLEELIQAALADGVLTEQEKQILFKRAKAYGVSLDEFEMVLNARLYQMKNEKTTDSKTYKLGDVRRCPACGATIGSFQMACPECGFEFSNVGPNKYVSDLSNALIRVQTEAQNKNEIVANAEINFLRTYPLPMTKEDCVEALNYILPKLTSMSNATRNSWLSMYKAILRKLKYENKDNPKIQKIALEYQQQIKFTPFEKIKYWYYGLSGAKKAIFYNVVLWTVIISSLLIIPLILEDNKKERINTQYEMLINKLDSLPQPNKNNLEECVYEVSMITWEPLFEKGKEKEIEDMKRESFTEKKNNYIRMLQKMGADIEEDYYYSYDDATYDDEAIEEDEIK